ncbi:hypothetical protein QZH41_001401 [Actinostola sp. cb2023]|nr:hypothetical protein QZH41_001401 [Actinostola sp. cb2023]
MKPNNTLQYVNTDSNHPPTVLKNIPEGINKKRLSEISSNDTEFNKAVPVYQKALDESGHNYKLHYVQDQPRAAKRNRKRNTIWYNPPYDRNVKTNVGKEFLRIIDKCFPPSNKLHKIFSRNTVKISYSCMPNVARIIDGDNKRKRGNDRNTDPGKMCSCPKSTVCPLGGECLAKNIVYQATVTCGDEVESYVGLTATDFKAREELQLVYVPACVQSGLFARLGTVVCSHGYVKQVIRSVFLQSCELVVVYMLSQLKSICGEAIGLYRDDGLAVFHDPPRLIECAKRKICTLFASNGLKITIEANKKVINYLDVTLDLNSGKHHPYMKPGNTPSYVHAKSNLPPNILKRIPESVNQRLSDISSDETAFNKAKPPYQAALDTSGYEHKLKFLPRDKRKKKSRARKRNITWFNPPFDMHVKTNLGK